MTPKIRVDLSESGCQKPKCPRRFAKGAQRHHKRHEKHWLNLWSRQGTPLFRGDPSLGAKMAHRLREHYYQFRKQDTVRLCEEHHMEIHRIYLQVLAEFQLRLRKHRKFFSFEEALLAMRLCRKACDEWLKTRSPGLTKKEGRILLGWGKRT